MARAYTNPSVLFVDQSGEIGGAELSLKAILDNYPGRKTVCLLADGPFRDLLDQRGIATTIVPLTVNIGRGSGMFKALAALPALLRASLKLGRLARDYDVVYGNTMRALVVAVAARPLHRKPVIWHLRDILDRNHFSATSIRLAVLAANWGTSTIIANSAATARAFCLAGGKREPVVIHNAIAASAFEPQNRPALRQALITKTGLDPDRPVLGLFGRLAAWKGQHIALDALKILPDAQLIIVGQPFAGDQGYAHYLADKIAASQLKKRVRLLGFRDDIPALMGGVDCVVHTSVAPEPFGRVIVEAMLAGTPVIASDAGGVGEIVTHGTTGMLFKPGNATALAKAISTVLTAPDVAAAMARAAREYAAHRFAPDAIFPSINALIRQTARLHR